MQKSIIQLVAAALVAFLATPANGQDSEWYGSLAAVYTNDDADRKIDDSLAGVQFRFGRTITERLSLEALLGSSNINGFPGQRHLELGVNALAFLDREAFFAPYAVAGIGYLGTSIDNAGEENRPSATLGIGFIWDFGDNSMSIRAEHRARLAYEQSNNLTDYISTVGLQIGFGAETSRRKHRFDSDGDGVIDHWDLCATTRRGVAVDDDGCPLDSDTDNDGVVDGEDMCRSTPAGADVDKYGCEKDDDNDHVFNRLDRCPRSHAGVPVDDDGCEIKDAD